MRSSLLSLLESAKKDLQYLATHWEEQFLPKEVEKLEKVTTDQGFWEDQEEAGKIMRKKKDLEERLLYLKTCRAQLDLCAEMLESSEILEDIELIVTELQASLYRKKLSCIFSELDESDCFLEIQPGAGGDDARNWAWMLFRMYRQYLQKAGYEFEILEEQFSEKERLERGLIRISRSDEALFPYGYLKCESGTHRLVRISPFNANKNRHTSFAAVDVFPVADRSVKIELDEKDIEKTFIRSSGAGGQSVNTTDSSVRLHHKPTGITVRCEKERSQYKNLEHAMNLLRAKIYKLEIQKREQAEQERRRGLGSIDWGTQIRSYTIHPYQLVRDEKTGCESQNPTKVLDGDLQEFLDRAVMFYGRGS